MMAALADLREAGILLCQDETISILQPKACHPSSCIPVELDKGGSRIPYGE